MTTTQEEDCTSGNSPAAKMKSICSWFLHWSHLHVCNLFHSNFLVWQKESHQCHAKNYNNQEIHQYHYILLLFPTSLLGFENHIHISILLNLLTVIFFF